MSWLSGKDGIVYGKAAQELAMSQSFKMRENATARLRGCDPAADGRDAFCFAGRDDAAVSQLRPAGVGEEGVSHFICEMSCGEVVAGSPLFPGRAFEFSFLPFSPRLHPSTLVALWVGGHLVATNDQESKARPTWAVRSNCPVNLAFSQIFSSRTLLFIW